MSSPKQLGLSEMFEPALLHMKNMDNAVFGPYSFLNYLRDNNIPNISATPEAISIDSYEKLHQSAKDNSAMIMRLGQAPGSKGTQFALVKVKGKLKDFFLIDDSIFETELTEYVPEDNVVQLKVFSLLPSLTENSYVNIGFSSGLISFALGVDQVKPIFPPTSCSSTFTFKFRPHSSISDEFIHSKGQVEIDAMFIEKRNNIDTLFIVEAKSDSIHRSLAKHKLLYPILGIAENVPLEIPIVPVYVKIKTSSMGIHFHVVECSIPDPRCRTVAYDELVVKRYSHLVLNLKRLCE
ncbi:DUF6997 domain-containing protein [Paenibacillus sp. MMS18-CY102]|uniref:DUF6997 domain-containing protein n=1 Tax=Paenibacillus sp. MMS18-CY102 TaxID=2682849 RepID=UPI0013660556|nr:hypothetical protein [Paenibacillus sp. MMS18-CY102]MWC31084.1 hypothetical protein [Paenibacillus sp. MMS18-CY102]